MQYKIIVDKQSRTNPSSEKKEYIIDIEELRVLGDVYDSLVITPEEDYVMRRLKLSEYYVLSVLEEPIKQPIPNVNIELFEGDNYIYLIDMEGNKFYAEYLIKNDFNNTFATKAEMNSVINQTAQSIELSVNQKLTGYSTTEEMNASINMKANEISQEVEKKIDEETITGAYLILKINNDSSESKLNADKVELTANDILNLIAGNALNLTSKKLTIISTNFNVDEDGNIAAKGGEIGGFTLDASKFLSNVNGIYNYNNYDLFHAFAISMGLIGENSIILDIDDVNGDGQIKATDYMKILNIINGNTANTKNVSGIFKINSKDPKNCISIMKGNDLSVSIGVGGIDSHMVTCKNFICGHMVNNSTNSASDFGGVTINGQTGEISTRASSFETGEDYEPRIFINPTSIGLYGEEDNCQITSSKIMLAGSNSQILLDAFYPVSVCHDLYSNASGTNGTVTLSEASSNFDSIEVFYGKGTEWQSSVKINSPNGKKAVLQLLLKSGGLVQAGAKQVSISGNTISVPANNYGGANLNANASVDVYSTNEIYIFKVVGYK